MQTKLLLSIIRLTTLGSVEVGQISEDSRIPIQIVRETLASLAKDSLVKIRGENLDTSSEQRIQLAIMAMREGASLENVCRYLGWKEFEDVTSLALEANHFTTQKRVHFKTPERRYEIDVVGFSEPMILSIDCKHWKRSWQRAATMKAVEAQLQRTEALARFLPKLRDKLRIHDWKKAELIPVVLTLSETPFRICKQVPVVSMIRFRSFLHDLPAHIDTLAYFKVNLQA